MKLFAVSFLTMSSLALVAAGCGTDEADDVSTTDDALLTCGGVHSNPGHHRGHHHGRHHHHHGGDDGAGGRPHLTGTAGTTGSTGTAGSMGMAGTNGAGGTGPMVDPRCVVPDGAVSWWHADGDFDDAIGTNDGNNAGAVAFGAGIDQQAFSMNGTLGSYVEVPSDPTLQMTGGITIDAWINTSTFGGRIVDKITAFGADGYLLDLLGDQVRIIVSPDLYTTSAHVPAAMWTHVAGTFDGTTMTIYYNGVQVGTQATAPHGVPANANTLRIGADSNGGSLYSGMIDEPRVFNRALSAAEMQTLFWQATNCP